MSEMGPTRWWRVVEADDRVWCESSDEAEARQALATCPTGGRLQRLYDRVEREWRDEP